MKKLQAIWCWIWYNTNYTSKLTIIPASISRYEDLNPRLGIFSWRVFLCVVFSNFWKILAESLSLPIIKKLVISAVGRSEFRRVLDRAPEKFSSSNNFLGVGRHCIPVSTIDTVKLFNWIKIRQMVSINHKIRFTGNHRNPVYRKGEPLINPNRKIHKSNGDNHGINNRCNKQKERISMKYLINDTLTKSLV